MYAPDIDAAPGVYTRHSPSSLNMFAAEPAMFVLERILGEKQTVGCKAHRGVAVERGVAHALIKRHGDDKEAIDIAHTEYDTLAAMSGDKRREYYREGIPAMVTQTLNELGPYGVPSELQAFVTWHPTDLIYPIVGYIDFKWADHGVIVDLKTTEKMPSKIKIPHARQVALYCGDNQAGRLTYVTPKKIATYALENVRAHRKALHQLARNAENFLALGKDKPPEYFCSITAPDLESFYWNDPVARELAFKYWRI